MNFEEYQDMNCWVKLILYLDIDVSTELRLYFSNSHVYDPGMYESCIGVSKSSKNFSFSFLSLTFFTKPRARRNVEVVEFVNTKGSESQTIF